MFLSYMCTHVHAYILHSFKGPSPSPSPSPSLPLSLPPPPPPPPILYILTISRPFLPSHYRSPSLLTSLSPSPSPSLIPSPLPSIPSISLSATALTLLAINSIWTTEHVSGCVNTPSNPGFPNVQPVKELYILYMYICCSAGYCNRFVGYPNLHV